MEDGVTYYTAIPADVLKSSTDADFTQRGKFGEPCHYCAQSNDLHHYACPHAIQPRVRNIRAIILRKITSPQINFAG